MKFVLWTAVFLLLVCFTPAVHADVFNLGVGLTNLDVVRVGQPGNPADTRYFTPGYGSVGYLYNIGKYEVTAAQYVDFLNAKAKSDPYGLYNANMSNPAPGEGWSGYGCNIQRSGTSGSYTYSVAADWANRPVNWVSFWDSLRFANWLNNGQGNGDTETGAYTLNGYNGGDGRTIRRNPGWKWAITSEDEWYKAAYYDPNKPGGAGYWDYPTRSNTAPANQVLATDPGNSANYSPWNGTTSVRSIGGPYYRTIVGEFENSASPCGAYDLAGNVWEPNETVQEITGGYAYRGSHGGSWINSTSSALQASTRIDSAPTTENYHIGFRLAQAVRACGTNSKAINDPIFPAASASYNFRVLGKVAVLGSSSFTLDDGSGRPVKVVAPGFSGIQNGNYAAASGGFSGEGSNLVLNAQVADIVKLR